jgi:ribonuclease-3
MNPIEKLLQKADEIESKLHYRFNDRSLLALAFTHRSFINENRSVASHNERLEFLGDSVLGMLMANFLFNRLPDTPEGELSYLRSRLVEAESCVAYVQKLDVEEYVLLGKGERIHDGRGRESILADLFEAIIGAIFLDGGLEAAERFVFKNCADQIEAILKTPWRNYKAVLQDYCQKNFQQTPRYAVLNETGPDHSKEFTIAVIIGEQELGKGMGSSKKEAQQAAAEDAVNRLHLSENP